MKNVIVFGNQKIAIDCIKILQNSHDINILCVVGSENANDKIFKYDSISEYCKKEKLHYYSAESLDNYVLNSFKEMNPTYCFSFYYRKIFKKEYISISSEGFINIHPSLLPKYRGPVPSMWAILNGESTAGITIHFIDEGIDSGDIIAQKEIEIDPNISGYDLNNKLIEGGVTLFQQTLPDIISNTFKRIEQDHKNATYYGPFTKSVQYINWYTKTADIFNKVRTFTKPYLGARGVINGKEIVILTVENVLRPKEKLNGPGKIIQVNNDNSFIVSTVDGYLLIKEYEFQDKNIDLNTYIFPTNCFSF